MTKEQLDAIRARLAVMSPGPWNWKAQRYYANNDSLLAAGNWGLNGPRTIEDAEVCAHVPTDLRALLDEVERLTNALAMAVQVSGELCEKCGWAMKFPGEPCRCELLAALNPCRLIDVGDGGMSREGTVMSDIASVRVGKLEWQSDISPKNMTWHEAKDYAASLGDGWRLPTRTELLTLVDDTKHSPSCSVFPDCPSEYFWTSTPWAGSSSGAWRVHFTSGSATTYGDVVSYGYRVRCVR
jgi:hypothetical protein